LHKFFDGKTDIGNDPAKGSGAHLFVIGDDGSGVRLVAAKDHVASRLPTENKSGAFQGSANLSA
jgi:hypothetical protein